MQDQDFALSLPAMRSKHRRIASSAPPHWLQEISPSMAVAIDGEAFDAFRKALDAANQLATPGIRSTPAGEALGRCLRRSHLADPQLFELPSSKGLANRRDFTSLTSTRMLVRHDLLSPSMTTICMTILP